MKKLHADSLAKLMVRVLLAGIEVAGLGEIPAFGVVKLAEAGAVDDKRRPRSAATARRRSNATASLPQASHHRKRAAAATLEMSMHLQDAMYRVLK
jgi:hypothetical protein